MKKRLIASGIAPLRDNILVTDMHFGERKTSTGIILAGDDAEQRGIRPRWARVISIGPEQIDIKVGEWILVNHGRWTRGIDLTDPETNKTITVRMIDPKDAICSCDTEPTDDYVAEKIA